MKKRGESNSAHSMQQKEQNRWERVFQSITKSERKKLNVMSAWADKNLVFIFLYDVHRKIRQLYMNDVWSFRFVLFLQIEPIRNFFAALFLASIGMLIHVHFLWNHVDILLAAVILVIIIKTVIIAVVVKGFGYNNKTSLLVSIVYYFSIITYASSKQGIDPCTGVNVVKITPNIFFKYSCSF